MAARTAMETPVIVLLLALTGIAFADETVSKESSVELTIHPPGGIKQGDDVTITCTAYGKNFLDVIRLVRSIKGEDYEINMNGVTADIFKETGRYEADEYQEEGGVGVVKVTIMDIQGDDGGNIGCKLLGNDPDPKGAFEDLVVAVPPENVTLKYQDQDGKIHIANADTPIQLKYGSETGIICESYVRGSDMEPAMELYLDDKKITNRFIKDYESQNTHNQGMRTLYYHKTLTYLVEEPEVREHGQTVKCTSKMPDFDELTAEAQLQIVYAPKLYCTPKYYVKIGATEVKLSCRASMNPAPTAFSFSWGKKGNRTTLTEGENEPGFSVSKEVLENNEYEFVLTVDEVTDFDFRKYKLNVENELGNAEFSIALREEGKPDPDDINSAEGLGKWSYTLPLLLMASVITSWLINTV